MGVRGGPAAGVIAIVLGVAGTSAAGNDEAPRLAVNVKNHAAVQRDDLARARTEGEGTFRHSGVAVAWVDDKEPRRLEILLLSLRRDSQECAAGCALGLALASRSTAYVFVNRIIRTTRSSPTDLPVVLGRVVAHEIGHILMPQRAHSTFGIMRADLDPGYTNPGRFSNEEAQAIRSRLRAGSEP